MPIKNSIHYNSGGYIAITTAIILSLMMLLVAAIFGSSALFARNNNLNFSLKKTSYFTAFSCLDYALLQLSLSGSYAGNQTRPVGPDQCTIQTIETSGSNKILKARSQVQGATTNLKMTVVTEDLSTVSLEEIQSF